MRKSGILGNLNVVVFLSVLILLLVLEFFGHIFERGVGHYLKWENQSRPQLGRVWERDREKIVAQKKIKSLLSGLNLQEQSTESLQTFNELFDNLTPSFPQLISRQKFLELYYDFPGPWARQIISPYDLLEIDSHNNWKRVLLSRFGQWITISFVDGQNFPIQEKFVAVDNLEDIESFRNVEKGRLDDLGFDPERIYSTAEFLQVLKTLDPLTQSALFPDPQWFLGKNLQVNRVGVKAESTSGSARILLGIEYQSDFGTHTLLVSVPQAVANNMLSQIERPSSENLMDSLTALGDF